MWYMKKIKNRGGCLQNGHGLVWGQGTIVTIVEPSQMFHIRRKSLFENIFDYHLYRIEVSWVMKKTAKKETISMTMIMPITLLIKTMTKFSNIIGYHQPNLSTNKTVYASCL